MKQELIEQIRQQTNTMPVILGPTACGKTALAVSIAAEIGAEIIGADSRQVYKGMDIGSGKDLAEYIYNGRPVPYHLIDVAEAGEEYNVFRYQSDFDKAYSQIKEKGGRAVLCGGSGLYLQAAIGSKKFAHVTENKELRAEYANKTQAELIDILKQYRLVHNNTDTEDRERCLRAIEIAHFEKTHPQETARIAPATRLIGIETEVKELRERISIRLDQRLKNGMIEEVETLLKSGLKAEQLTYYGLEYRYITEYLNNKYISVEEMRNKLYFAICQFAKRQRTYFRGMERKGWKIEWIRL